MIRTEDGAAGEWSVEETGARRTRRTRGGRALASLLLGLFASLAALHAAEAVPGPRGPALHLPTFSVQDGVERQHTAADEQDAVDRAQLLRDLEILAHDSMEGRRTGTEGIERARRYLVERFEETGLRPFDGAYERPFRAESPDAGEPLEAVNLVGYVPGTENPERVMVVTAHYDHLGIREGEIYNGADDNASGTAGLLALARHFVSNPPLHTIVFAALDAEEIGLQGAREFVAGPPVSLSRIRLNVNLDMVSRSEAGELYVAGTYHYPFLGDLLDEVEPGPEVELLRGHDRPDLPPGDDWTMASDHAAFHEVGIPFLYFGVEDHAGYHAPSDTFENITPDFFVGAVETALRVARVADERLAEILVELPSGSGR